MIDNIINEKDILSTFFQEYTCVYCLDLERDIAVAYYLSDYMDRHYPEIKIGKEFSYISGIRLFIERQAFEEDKKMLSDITKTENIIEVLSKKNSFQVVYRTKPIEGKPLYCQLKYTILKEDKSKILLSFKDCDLEIQKQLDYRLTLNKALDNAELASLSKSTFLFNMSHDLKTPMNAIMGLTELAKKHISNNERVYECLEKIGFASDNLLSLINDILDMARLESGKIKSTLETTNIKLLISNLVEMIKSSSGVFDTNIQCNYVDVVHCNLNVDIIHLNQILLNIIDNAIKYSKPNGNIYITVTEIQNENPSISSFKFEIKDEGIGINPGFMKDLFEPFTRERNSTISGIQGTGLGMSITKKLVELLKGKIYVESELNKGTTFTLYFDFKNMVKNHQTINLEDIRNNIKENSNLSNKTILVVDDNDLNREIAKDILIDHEINVISVDDGKKAVDIMMSDEAEKINAILMDIQMPVMNGYTATKKIRALHNQKIANIPIIALTANTFEEDKKNCIAVGMNDHISKPVSSRKLLEIIKRYC